MAKTHPIQPATDATPRAVGATVCEAVFGAYGRRVALALTCVWASLAAVATLASHVQGAVLHWCAADGAPYLHWAVTAVGVHVTGVLVAAAVFVGGAVSVTATGLVLAARAAARRVRTAARR